MQRKPTKGPRDASPWPCGFDGSAKRTGFGRRVDARLIGSVRRVARDLDLPYTDDRIERQKAVPHQLE